MIINKISSHSAKLNSTVLVKSNYFIQNGVFYRYIKKVLKTIMTYIIVKIHQSTLPCRTQSGHQSLAAMNNRVNSSFRRLCSFTAAFVLSRLASHLPRHCSVVHVCECDSECALHSLWLHAFLSSCVADCVVYPPGIKGLNGFLETLQRGNQGTFINSQLEQ